MASPQKENGFTSIANELYERILQAKFTSRELKVVFCIIRYTYGFNRKKAELSLRFIAKATAIKFQHIGEVISKLIKKKVVIIIEGQTHKQGRIISLNKDYETWDLESPQIRNSSHKGDGIATERVTVRVHKRVTKKESKENIKKIELEKKFGYLSRLLFSLMKEHDPKAKEPNYDNWNIHLDRLNRIDNRTLDEIEGIIRFSQSDNFWCQNILSTEKFRKQFSSLLLKSNSKNNVNWKNDKPREVTNNGNPNSFTQQQLLISKNGKNENIHTK